MKNAIILVLFTGVIFFTGWWISDEPLNPVAQKWIDKPQVENQPYNILLGLGSAPGLSAQEEGKRLYHQRLTEPTTATPNHFGGFNDDPLLCDYSTYECLQNQRLHIEESKSLLVEKKVLIDRYLQLLSAGNYVDNTPLSLTAEFPHYSLLVKAARLHSLQLLSQSDPTSALETEISQLREFLTQDHNLIGKLVTARILSEKFQLAALLVQEGMDISLSDYRLSHEEKSLATALRNEFRLRAFFLINEEYNQDSAGSSVWERLALNMGMRTNIMINRDLAYTLHFADLSENPASVIVEDHYVMQEPTLGQTLRNPFGNYLLEMATPDIKHYLLRMAHLDAKLQLLGWLRHPDEAHPNPWPESSAIQINEKERQICFPTEQNQAEQNSCLPWVPAP